MAKERPNVLCILTDQMRADHMGCAGHPVVRTPNLDRLAASGVRFERAYVNNPLCMPGRATMFTGMTPRGHRVRTNGIDLDDSVPSMPETLRRAGYRTHAVGKLHLKTMGIPDNIDLKAVDPAKWPEAGKVWRAGRIEKMPSPYFGLETVELCNGHGPWVSGDYLNWLRSEHPGAEKLLQFENAAERSETPDCWKMSLPAELHFSHWIADRTIDFLKTQAKSKKPFFCWTSFPDPHHPYCPPRPWADMYNAADIPLPARRPGEFDDLPPFMRQTCEKGCRLSGRMPGKPTNHTNEQIREILALTFGMISQTDHHIGRILDALEQINLRENTIVMFMSDHGDMMGDHGLLNKGPFHFEGLLRVPFIWSWPGRFPAGRTACALASMLDFVPTVHELTGVAVDEGRAVNRVESPEELPPLPGHSLMPVLTNPKKSVQDSVIVENDEDYLGTQVRTLITRNAKLTLYSHKDWGELFDLRDDPNELHNLFDDPDAEDLRNEMTAKLLARLIETDSVYPRRKTHA